MPTVEQELTPRLMLGQMLRAIFKMAKDAVSARFAPREAVSFTVAGQAIRGYFYYPNSENKTPGILLLSTAAGLTPHEHAFAARVARAGYTTLVVGYTRRTTGRAVMNNEAQRKRLEQIVVGSWRLLQVNDHVDGARTAVVGFSLGGYFAVHVATAIKEFGPKPVVIYYGMYALAGSELMRSSIPLLLLQGENDDDDFVGNAKRLREIGVRDEKPWEVVFYPGAGHQFDLFEPRGPAARDAWERTARFLGEHLASATQGSRNNLTPR